MEKSDYECCEEQNKAKDNVNMQNRVVDDDYTIYEIDTECVMEKAMGNKK